MILVLYDYNITWTHHASLARRDIPALNSAKLLLFMRVRQKLEVNIQFFVVWELFWYLL